MNGINSAVGPPGLWQEARNAEGTAMVKYLCDFTLISMHN